MKVKKRTGKNEDDNGFAAWGGYMEAKKFKLLEQFTDTIDNTNKKSDIFKGISVFVNGYTKPTADEIKNIMTLHGGIYHHYHNPSKTTYIIASNLPDTKIKQLGSNQKIVKPEWISESLLSGKLLDYTKYLLYTNCNRKQRKLNFEKVVYEELITETIATENKNDDFQLSPDMFGSFDDDISINNIQVQASNKDVENASKNNTIIKQFENKTEKKFDKSNRILTANDPKFLSEFYNNSRLHHISTLGTTFKQHVCNLREQSNFKFPERQKLKDYLKSIKRDEYNFLLSEKQTVVMHIDMDCFFVSVGLRKRPDLRGVPVAVTHSKGGQEPTIRSGVDRQAELDCYKQRIQDKLKLKTVDLGPGNMLNRLENIGTESMSEIASCSYEARKVGVKNGMFMGAALKLCPNLQTIPYDFDDYKEVANTLYNTISEYTLNIEAVSCDEMFVEITELLKDTGATVKEWATYIRSLIQKRTCCPCSTGFGLNRLQARLATKTAKPNGQFYLVPEDVEKYMTDIKVDDLPGVGRSHSLKLKSLGIQICGDLQSMSINQLKSEFGNKVGESLFNHCRGIDDRPLVYEHERKSVSAEINYGIRFQNNIETETFLKQLVSEVHARLTEIKMKGKCIVLKLMVRSKDAPQESSKYMGHGICDYITKSSSLSTPTNELRVIEREVLLITQKLAIPPQELRGIGIQITKLEKIKNGHLLGEITKFLSTTNKTKSSANTYESVSIKNNLKTELHILSKTNLQVTNNAKPKESNDLNKNKDIIIKEDSPNTEKSSPIKNNEINITKRGRGKSRGRGGKTIERKSSNNGNLTKYWASTSSANKSQEEVFLDGVDMEVFAALPKDIQKEVISQFQVQRKSTTNNTNTNKQTINLAEDKQGNEDKDQRNIITKKTSEVKVNPNNNKNDNMFYNMDIKEVKGILEEWILSENTPEVCDIKMLGEYFKQMALDKKIDNLFMILKFLFSEITFKNTCGWHIAYFEVVKMAQEGMIAKYGSKIWTCKDFKCKNKCHLSS